MINIPDPKYLEIMNKSAIKKIFQNNNRNFYFLLLITFIFILFSHPFLKYPYDMWRDLVFIDDVYRINKVVYKRELWYLFWADVFHLSSIEDFFIRARIIHIVQTAICLFSVFFFSRVLIRNIFKDINNIHLNYLSYWSALVWLTIYATFSMVTHQVWVMWYSINYQIALAFFWYITALTLILVVEEKAWPIKLFYCTQIVLFSYIMLSIHPMELVYYFMYLFLIGIVFFDKIIHFIRVKYCVVLPVLFVGIASQYIFFTYYFKYKDRLPPIIKIIKNDGLTTLYEVVIKNGLDLISGLNRSFASINELMIVIFFIGLVLSVDIIRRHLLKKVYKINIRLLIFTIISTLFVVIPLFQFSAGLASVIFFNEVVHRIYYSSSLYVLLPVGVYYFLINYNHKVSLSKINISIISIVIVTTLYSRFFSESHNYYKNVMSLVDSYDQRKVGFQLSPDNIKTIGVLLNNYEREIPKNGKSIIYFARSDISFVLKYIYKRDVYQKLSWNGQNNLKTFKQFADYSKDPKVLKTKIPFIFRIPPSFPRYIPYS